MDAHGFESLPPIRSGSPSTPIWFSPPMKTESRSTRSASTATRASIHRDQRPIFTFHNEVLNAVAAPGRSPTPPELESINASTVLVKERSMDESDRLRRTRMTHASFSTAQIAALKNQVSASGCTSSTSPVREEYARATRLWNGAVERKPSPSSRLVLRRTVFARLCWQRRQSDFQCRCAMAVRTGLGEPCGTAASFSTWLLCATAR